MMLLRNAAQGLLDLVFPPKCVVCGRPDWELCADCVAEFPLLQPPLCDICSQPITVGELRCERCSMQRPAFGHVWSAFRYEGGIRDAVRALKYNKHRAMAHHLVEAARPHLPHPRQADLVLVAVPTSQERLAERGFNQAQLIAEELGAAWGVSVLPPAALQRVHHTETQVGLTRDERLANLRGAFVGKADYCAGQQIVLIDDVCTTGATLDACARALLAADARSVHAVTVARTP